MGFRWLGTWPVLDEVHAVEARRARAEEGRVADRVKLKVRWNRTRRVWMVVLAGPDVNVGLVPDHDTKRLATRHATRKARALHEQTGFNAQVVILNKNGRIQEERTYGADPRRHKG